jgi:hypothetical protein
VTEATAPQGGQLQFVFGPLDGKGSGRGHDVAEPEAEGQEIFDRDRPCGRHRVVERPVDALQDTPVGQFGQERLHRIVRSEHAVVDQHHGARGTDRLGDRRDAKDGVSSERRRIVEGERAEHFDVHVTPPRDQRHQTGDVTALDVGPEAGVQPDQPLLRESHARRG